MKALVALLLMAWPESPRPFIGALFATPSEMPPCMTTRPLPVCLRFCVKCDSGIHKGKTMNAMAAASGPCDAACRAWSLEMLGGGMHEVPCPGGADAGFPQT